MAKVIIGRFGKRPLKPPRTMGWVKYEAQETGEPPPPPDIKRPPDQELPDIVRDVPEVPDGPGAPPFTGEDVEDPDDPKPGDLPTM